VVDADRFENLTALQTRRTIYGKPRRVILTHSPTLHTKQRAGLEQTLAKATGRLSELASRLARGKPAATGRASSLTSKASAVTAGSNVYCPRR
jgi:hypothetical protein